MFLKMKVDLGLRRTVRREHCSFWWEGGLLFIYGGILKNLNKQGVGGGGGWLARDGQVFRISIQ